MCSGCSFRRRCVPHGITPPCWPWRPTGLISQYQSFCHGSPSMASEQTRINKHFIDSRNKDYDVPNYESGSFWRVARFIGTDFRAEACRSAVVVLPPHMQPSTCNNLRFYSMVSFLSLDQNKQYLEEPQPQQSKQQ